VDKPKIPLLEPSAISRRQRRLPHWEADNAIYFVTFRLADSLPESAVEAYRLAKEDLLRRKKRAPQEEQREISLGLWRLYETRISELLDSGRGECLLASSTAAMVVRGALQHFDWERYDLYAYAIMPNHVHTVVGLTTVGSLERVLHSWKSFSSNQINRVLGRSGPLWQQESFDHLIRSEADFDRCVKYTLENPDKAGLHDWPWVWSAFSGPSVDHGLGYRLEAGATGGGVQ